MKQVCSNWPSRDLLAIWRRFARNLTGNAIGIRVYTEFEPWRKCLARVTGLPTRLSGGACASLFKGQFTIHLYVPDTWWLEERFDLFLHELAHIHLGHFGKRRGSYFDKENEAEAWVAVNFSDELKTVDRCIHWRRFQRESALLLKRKTIPPALKRRARKELGDWFFITDVEKAPLLPWLTEVERDLQWSVRMDVRMAGVSERSTAPTAIREKVMEVVHELRRIPVSRKAKTRSLKSKVGPGQPEPPVRAGDFAPPSAEDTWQYIRRWYCRGSRQLIVEAPGFPEFLRREATIVECPRRGSKTVRIKANDQIKCWPIGWLRPIISSEIHLPLLPSE